jgi:membrane-associated phospholipid phosphatase
VYLLYFPACFLPLTIREIRDDEETFRRTALGFAVQFGVSFFIFWLVPSHILRPETGAGGASNGALRWLYALDPGFNVFPSLHVANVAYVACLIGRLRGAATAAPVWFLWVLIAGSTLLIKQHFLVDVAAGTFLGIFSCSLAFHADLFRARVPAPVVLAANLAADVPPIA